ncbi:uracil-DNA glycosylase 2-like [Brevipalpus obovatus]|uniref:uracil-DNA glycosylase 2-like n=1 Tax=Brevipalpus obovatus TaxID=246614 RepID=UPI003D9FAC76
MILSRGRSLILTSMAQQSITSFFKPRPTTTNNPIEDTSPAKKRKREEGLEVRVEDESFKKARNEKLSSEFKELCGKNEALSTEFGISWYCSLRAEFSKPYFVKLGDFLASERKQHQIYPPKDQVFTWTKACNIEDVKVVILGQDPYHGPNQGHGLCFSVQKGVQTPPSLINIFKELENDIPGFISPHHGNLSGWAKQGVLLLNAVLTVRRGCANSHQNKGWEEFTTAVIKALTRKHRNLVFLLWGKPAQMKCSFINDKEHLVLKCTHPSPLSCHRGFFGCKHFSKTNEYLRKHGKEPIDWQSTCLED